MIIRRDRLIKNKRIFDIFASVVIFIFGVLINRSVSTNSTILGEILKNYSENLLYFR